MSLVRKKIAVCGGDKREIILIRALVENEYYVHGFGLPPQVLPSALKLYPTFSETIIDVDAVILPLPGINQQGKLHATLISREIFISLEDFSPLTRDVPIFVGTASAYLKNIVKIKGNPLIEVGEYDEVAIPNSIPTAEGAIQVAMEKLPITLNQSESYVIGFGRVAETLSLKLKGLGANVTVFVRDISSVYKSQAMGYQGKYLNELATLAPMADVIFNTVPAPVIGKTVLNQLRKETLIIDLATSPGGTDFEAADTLGITALLAPGLPGKVAPLTAGQILAKAYPRIIDAYLNKP